MKYVAYLDLNQITSLASPVLSMYGGFNRIFLSMFFKHNAVAAF